MNETERYQYNFTMLFSYLYSLEEAVDVNAPMKSFCFSKNGKGKHPSTYNENQLETTVVVQAKDYTVGNVLLVLAYYITFNPDVLVKDINTMFDEYVSPNAVVQEIDRVMNTTQFIPDTHILEFGTTFNGEIANNAGNIEEVHGVMLP